MDRTATYDRHALEKKLLDPTAQPIYLPLQFLKDITSNFSTEEELGRGGYGIVYRGVLRRGRIIAVKKIYDIHLVDDDQFRREVSYLIGIKHQNVVQLVGYCAESRWEAMQLPMGIQFVELPTRLLCFEYLCNESLDKYISDESSGLEWYKRFEIINGICNGLHFLHEKHVVHLDLKPENILMDASMVPKVADFGLSRLLGAEKSRTIINGNLVGSRGYMAPEYSFQGIVSQKADIFSFGVIIIEIITGRRDYPLICTVPYVQKFASNQSIEMSLQQYIDTVLARWMNIFQKEPKYRSSEVYAKQVKECMTIALRCVDHDSSRRPNALEIFQMLRAVVYPTLPAERPAWKLVFRTSPSRVIGFPIIVDCFEKPLEIILMDTESGSPAKIQQELRVELVLLYADFPPDGREDWSAEEFQKGIVKVREGSLPILSGDVSLTMRNGRAVVFDLGFTSDFVIDNPIHGKEFRIGARVLPGSYDGARILEATTETFVVFMPLKTYGRNLEHLINMDN